MNAPVTVGNQGMQPGQDPMGLNRVQRDSLNAVEVPLAAAEALKHQFGFTPASSMAHGTAKPQIRLAEALRGEGVALRVLTRHAFDAMLEAEVENAAGTMTVLWYAHKSIGHNLTVRVGNEDVRVLAWSHPAFQIGASAPLGERRGIGSSQLVIKTVRPVARARFTQLVPALAGVYEPGGVVSSGETQAAKPKVGLKAVKLEMTPEQVEAFIARMGGLLLVTGAPGTGKTTVAFQRIRFLLDQQDLREHKGVPHAPALTRVFLASQNLIKYSKRLLKDELEIPEEVVSYVPDFVKKYVAASWRVTGRARPSTRKMDPSVERAREAMLNLCAAKDLHGVWSALEQQVIERLQDSGTSDWKTIAAKEGVQARVAAESLATDVAAAPRRSTRELLDSPYRMDALWRRARKPYGDCRAAMREGARDKFDEAFASWLYWVYDPLDALHAYFTTQTPASLKRIKAGTGGSQASQAIVDEVLADWKRRLYGDAELSWVAWLLRFSLPEDADVDDAFRALPRALPQPDHREQRRWTHIVIDEAQDLSVQEASLLASFVHAAGALTVSADFNQIVSPVHGMTDAEALKVGLAIRDRQLYMQFPFKRNLRQGREIGQFLRGFYQSAFGELAPFDAGDRSEGFKPQVQIGPSSQFPLRIKQVAAVLQQKGNLRSLAVLFVHDDQHALRKMRSSLRDLGLPVASPEMLLDPEKVVVTTVEKAKGLEFEVCIVIGLDDVERAALNFSKNRAYVALSRPTRKLLMLCQQDPTLLHGVPKNLFDRAVFS